MRVPADLFARALAHSCRCATTLGAPRARAARTVVALASLTIAAAACGPAPTAPAGPRVVARPALLDTSTDSTHAFDPTAPIDTTTAPDGGGHVDPRI